MGGQSRSRWLSTAIKSVSQRGKQSSKDRNEWIEKVVQGER